MTVYIGLHLRWENIKTYTSFLLHCRDVLHQPVPWIVASKDILSTADTPLPFGLPSVLWFIVEEVWSRYVFWGVLLSGMVSGLCSHSSVLPSLLLLLCCFAALLLFLICQCEGLKHCNTSKARDER